MEPAVLSERYQVRRLTEEDVEAIYQLCAENPLFYQHCPPFVTRESIRADSRALPPGKTAADKYYLGYFQGDKLAAVLDLILDYPRAQTAFVGFFMLARRRLRHRGGGPPGAGPAGVYPCAPGLCEGKSPERGLLAEKRLSPHRHRDAPGLLHRGGAGAPHGAAGVSAYNRSRPGLKTRPGRVAVQPAPRQQPLAASTVAASSHFPCHPLLPP